MQKLVSTSLAVELQHLGYLLLGLHIAKGLSLEIDGKMAELQLSKLKTPEDDDNVAKLLDTDCTTEEYSSHWCQALTCEKRRA